MAMPVLENDRYPIGRFERPHGPLDAAARAQLIDAIEEAPATLRSLVERLDDRQLDRPYREGGWTIRQVVHHVPDSHMNMYIRMKLAVTEDTPVIKPYDEVRWAELPDGRSAPISMSLDLLDALHRRWVVFLRALPEDQFQRRFVHPELGSVAIFEALAMYAWHGRHHTGHIERALSR
jgi:DinB family protein